MISIKIGLKLKLEAGSYSDYGVCFKAISIVDRGLVMNLCMHPRVAYAVSYQWQWFSGLKKILKRLGMY